MASNKENSDGTDVSTEEIDDRTNKGKSPTERPWQEDKGVPESLLYAYENSLWTDVTLECTAENGDVQFIKAHKMILASRNTVFEAMLFGPAADKGDIIQISRFSYELMDLLLKYLYSEKTHITESTARPMFEMAYFYQVPALINLCSQYIQSIFRDDSVCGILELALLYGNVGLRDAACDYIDQNAITVIETDGFLQVSEICLEFMVRGDTFHVDEKTILRRAIEWAKNHEIKDGLNKDRNLDKNIKNPSDISVKHFKSTLGNAFQYIRLGAMSVGEFSECVESTLSAEEIKDILKFPKNCSTKEFHPHRLPKKETLEFKNGKTTWSSCQKSSSRNSGLFSSSSESMYEITVRKSLIICKGITFSEISVLVDILGERFVSMQTTKAVDPNLDFTVKMNIKIARTRLNYSFITTIQDLSAYDLEFDSPICLRASEDPYKVVVKMELQPTPLNITFTTNQCGVGSAEIENAKVEWNNQFSILHKILFSNTSNRVSKGKERKKMDDDEK